MISRLLALFLLLATLASGVTALSPGDAAKADGEYSYPPLRAGNAYTYSLSGSFGGGTATIGYLNAAGAFTSLGSTFTAAGSVTKVLPESSTAGQGVPAISLSGATSPALVLTLTQTPAGTTVMDNAAVVSAIAEDPAASQTAIGLVPSTTGGANQVLKTDSNGNLKLAPLRTMAATGSLVSDGGNLILTDRQMVAWHAADGISSSGDPTGDGQMLFRIRQDNSHPHETNFDFGGRGCLYWGINYPDTYNAFQIGSANGGKHFLYFHSGYADAGTPERQSVPVVGNTSIWNGSATVFNFMGMQAAPLDTSGTNSAWNFYSNLTGLGSYQDMSGHGTHIAAITDEGIWSPGTAPTFTTLDDSSGTVTVTCSKYKTAQVGMVTLSGNRTLNLSGLISGMRGVLYVTQDATGSRTLTPAGSSTAIDLSATASVTDRVTWDYDGTFANFAVEKAIQREAIVGDSDAAAFIAAAGITSSTEKAAINTLVESLKAESLWTRFFAIYPFVGDVGDGVANSKDLKAAYNITWSGTLTHNSNGVTGNGTNGYGNTGINLNTLSAVNSASGYIYSRTQNPTTGGYFFGVTTTPRFAIYQAGSSVGAAGPNDATNGALSCPASSDYRRHVALNRSGASAAALYVDSTKASSTTASTSAPDAPIYLLCRNASGPSGYSNANLAFAAFGSSLSESEWTALRAAVDAFETALGRQN